MQRYGERVMSELDFAVRPPGRGPGRASETLPRPADAALFLDFDGTLVDLAERPDAIVVPDGTEALLSALLDATGGHLALVSGRRLADIESYLPGFAGPVVASHGAEFREGAERRRHPAAGSDDLARLKDVVRARTPKGVLVEDKPVSIVLHFRQAPAALEPTTRTMEEVVARFPGYILHRAKMALELKPDDVSKGRAVARFLDGPWFGRAPVAIGDDATDETMFAEVLERGGVAVRVGAGETLARHRVEDPAEVHAVLKHWLERSAGQ